MKKIKLGIVGCGRVAQHYKFILDSGIVKNFVVSSVCDKEIEKAKKFSQNFNCKYFDKIEEMINNTEIDLIIILTPSGEHFNNSKISLTMGCHTLVEKPITLLPNQAEELEKISTSSNLMYGVVYQNRFNPAIQLLDKELKLGNFGKIITSSIRLRWCRMQEYYQDEWHGTWKQDGGVLAQQGIHYIDLLCYFFGKPLKAISVLSNVSNKLEAEDTHIGIIKFKNATCTIGLTTALRPTDLKGSIEIICQKNIKITQK